MVLSQSRVVALQCLVARPGSNEGQKVKYGEKGDGHSSRRRPTLGAMKLPSSHISHLQLRCSFIPIRFLETEVPLTYPTLWTYGFPRYSTPYVYPLKASDNNRGGTVKVAPHVLSPGIRRNRKIFSFVKDEELLLRQVRSKYDVQRREASSYFILRISLLS